MYVSAIQTCFILIHLPYVSNVYLLLCSEDLWSYQNRWCKKMGRLEMAKTAKKIVFDAFLWEFPWQVQLSDVRQTKILKVDCSCMGRVKKIVFNPFPVRPLSLTRKLSDVKQLTAVRKVLRSWIACSPQLFCCESSHLTGTVVYCVGHKLLIVSHTTYADINYTYSML